MMKTNNPKTGHRSELPVLSERVSLGVREAATALGVSEGLVRKWLPELPHVHLGERVLIPVDELKRWLQERSRAEQQSSRGAVREILDEIRRGSNE
jgi:excisionase family DNA binding protein